MSRELQQDLITGIPREELSARRERLLAHIRDQKLTGYVLFDEHYIQYFTSFSFLATERPVAFAANASGEMVVFVPGFEVERVREETEFERVESYPEYPGVEHPMLILGRDGHHRRARCGQRRLSRHPRLRGAFAESGDGRRNNSPLGVHREPDGAEE
ncbi:MAG: aminopeptidase P family N-terminal domain-containing protein [Solirubrobacteraceae bacterium]